MAISEEVESIVSELRESIEELEEEEQHSDYSLEFDEDNEALASGERGSGRDDDFEEQLNPPASKGPTVADADVHLAKRPRHHQQQHWSRQVGSSGGGKLHEHSPERQRRGTRASAKEDTFLSAADPATVAEAGRLRDKESADREETVPVQVRALRARLDGLLQHGGDHLTATEAFTAVTREHAALRECLGQIESELVAARQKVANDAAARLRAVQGKRARAEARRVRHFEQLGEARRVAMTAKAEAEALRARLENAATELRHTKEMLEAVRSAAATAERNADRCQKAFAAAELASEKLQQELLEARSEVEEERRRSSVVARDAADKIELCERKRELEVDAALRVAQARERAAEDQLKNLPDHQKQLLQAEMDRLVRWEERLAAESASLQRREEAHKIEMEAHRAHALRIEAEARTRIEEDTSRKQSLLKEAKFSLEVERGDLLRRVAEAEAARVAAAAEAAERTAAAEEARRRTEAERSALEVKASTLAPQLRALEERQRAADELQREAREEFRRAREKACRALERESEVVEREAALEVKWKEISTARQALKQMEQAWTNDAEALCEQRKAVALARVRLHEQQMEMTLQMTEIRKALELLKRVHAIEDAPARRMALELGELACDRGEMAARRAQDPGEMSASDGGGGGLGGGGGGRVGGGGGDSAWGGNGGGGVTKADTTLCGSGGGRATGGADESDKLLAAPSQGAGRILAAATARASGAGEATGDAVVMWRGHRGYTDEERAMEALKQVRSVIASTGGGAGGVGCRGPPRLGSCADEGGGTSGGLTVRGWATKIRAAATSTGALWQ